MQELYIKVPHHSDMPKRATDGLAYKITTSIGALREGARGICYLIRP